MTFRRRKYAYWVIGFVVFFFVLPNVINFREREAFSDDLRLKEARNIPPGTDSINVTPGKYYKRGTFYCLFFGEKNRELWATPVSVKILDPASVKGGLVPYAEGGSQQTISVRMTDSAGRHWVLRSVNKDQQNALPPVLRHSILRSIFRDQVAAINPYGPKITSVLADALGLPHAHPELYYMPYHEKFGEYNKRIAGRLVYLEEHIDSSWCNNPVFRNAISFLDTYEMLDTTKRAHIPVDTLLYLETRLFDMLISDWDRHEEQWRWAIVNNNGRTMITPIAKDRDMSFYIFDEGLFSIALLGINPKFQSFRKDYKNVKGLMWQSGDIDRKILRGIPKEVYLNIVEKIHAGLTPAAIHRAFMEYPPAVYAKTGKYHEGVLAHRLAKLPAAAVEFHRLVNN